MVFSWSYCWGSKLGAGLQKIARAPNGGTSDVRRDGGGLSWGAAQPQSRCATGTVTPSCVGSFFRPIMFCYLSCDCSDVLYCLAQLRYGMDLLSNLSQRFRIMNFAYVAICLFGAFGAQRCFS